MAERMIIRLQQFLCQEKKQLKCNVAKQPKPWEVY